MSKIIDALAANIVNVKFGDIDKQTIEDIKNQIIDIVGCILGGIKAPGNFELVSLVKKWGGKKEASIIAYGGKVPAKNAAMVNSIMARSYDFECLAYSLNGRSGGAPHGSGTYVPTAIAMGESTHANGKDLITALVVGNDIACRIYSGCSRPFEFDPKLGVIRHFVPWGTIATFGATAIAGRLLGLSFSQMKEAFGIAISMMSGAGNPIMDEEGGHTFKLNQGTSARDGIFAAELAKIGWTGASDPLLGRWGYYENFAGGVCDRPELLIENLGKKFYHETQCKAYPGGGPMHAPYEAALAIANKYNIKPEEVEEITLFVVRKSQWYAKPFKTGKYPLCNALFSYYYAVATALVRKSVSLENFTDEAILDQRIQQLIPKIKLEEIPKEKAEGWKGITPFSVELHVKMKDGQEFIERVNAARGMHPGLYLSREEIIAKFMAQVRFTNAITEENARRLIELILRLEEVDDVSQLVGLMVK